MIRVTHVITGLGIGGAERALFNLLSRLSPETATRTRVVSLTTHGRYGALIEALGIPVEALNLSRKPTSWLRFFRWRTTLRVDAPDVVVAWMYHANVIAWLAIRCLERRPALIWNVRHALYSLYDEKPTTQWVIRAHRWLSERVRAIVYNSHLALEQHWSYGIRGGRSLVIPNGFDLKRWFPDDEAGSALRQMHGIADSAVVVGHVARFHVLKDQATLLRAMCDVMHCQHEVHLVLIGRGLDRANPVLTSLIDALPQARLHVFGERNDVENLMRMMDIFCLSSRSEAFPNVLGEAMASGVVCVTTDAGDAREMVGDIGNVVPPGDARALGMAVESFVVMGRVELKRKGRAARARIEECYAIERTVEAYQKLLSER